MIDEKMVSENRTIPYTILWKTTNFAIPATTTLAYVSIKREVCGNIRLTVPPFGISERQKISALVPSEVSTSGTSQPLIRLTGCSHTHGRGIERIITSVNISDQACARYIMVVSIQVPGAAPILVQFADIGKHCKRLAAKNAMVHVTTRPIIIHEMMENVLVKKILRPKLACLVSL